MFTNLILACATLAGCATAVTHDPGGADQYPATIVHYGPAWQEDDAGTDCANRGGSLTDDPAEFYVCVID